MSNTKPQYLVQPDYLGERKANYKAGELMNKKFEMVTSEEAHKNGGLCGNVGSNVMVSLKTRKITISKKYLSSADTQKTHVRLYQAISSALALYRIICMFQEPKIEMQGAGGYKCPWFAYFKHKETGACIALGEWKGAFGLWTLFHDPKELPIELEKDVIKLLELLLSDRAPHPYDNVTAGSVA